MDTVVNRHYKLRRTEQRRFVMRYMNKVHILPAQSQRDRDVIPPESMTFGLIELSEVCRQGAEFVKIPVRADQQVLVLAVDRGEIAHQIPDIGSHSKLIDFPDVNGDAHGIDGNFSIIAVC